MIGPAPTFRRPDRRRRRVLAAVAAALSVAALGATSLLAADGLALAWTGRPLALPWGGEVTPPASAAPVLAPVATVAPRPTATAPGPSASPPPPTPGPAPSATPGPLPPRVSYRLPTREKVVALTFDDGWSAANGRRILAILRAEGVPATFFVNGIYLDRSPDFWREVAAAGLPVANHAWHHRDMTRFDAATVEAELLSTAERFAAITGASMAPYFRPPFGARDATTDDAAARAGFADVVLWNIVSGDTGRHATAASLVRNASKGGPGAIILMHVGPDVTAQALPAIIAAYRERGFRFVTIPELLAPRPLPAGVPGPG